MSTDVPTDTERRQAIATAACSASPAQMLAAGAEAIAAGQVQAGTDLVYAAARKAVMQAAARQGIPCDTEQDIDDFLHRMDGIPPIPPDWDTERRIHHYQRYMNGNHLTFLTDFHIARSFREHAATPMAIQKQIPDRYWAPDEYAIFIGPVRELVETLEHAPLPEIAN